MTSLPSGYPTQSWTASPQQKKRGEACLFADIIIMPWNIIMYKCATKCPKILLKSLSYPIKYMGDPRYGKTEFGSRNPVSKSRRIPNNTVCSIRIRRTNMFFGLPDPHLDPLVRDMDPDPDPIIKQNSKKNIDFYCFVTSLWLLSLKNYADGPQKVISKKYLLTPWRRSLMKITGSGSGSRSESISQRYRSADPHPDPYQNFLYPQHWSLHCQFNKNISDNLS
jgi:hypothetical protein